MTKVHILLKMHFGGAFLCLRGFVVSFSTLLFLSLTVLLSLSHLSLSLSLSLSPSLSLSISPSLSLYLSLSLTLSLSLSPSLSLSISLSLFSLNVGGINSKFHCLMQFLCFKNHKTSNKLHFVVAWSIILSYMKMICIYLIKHFVFLQD